MCVYMCVCVCMHACVRACVLRVCVRACVRVCALAFFDLHMDNTPSGSETNDKVCVL